VPLRLEAVPRRDRVGRLEPIVLRVRLVNGSNELFTAAHHFLSHAPFPNHVWWEARLGDGRFVTNMPMVSMTCPASAGHELEMGTMSIPAHGAIEFDLTAEGGLQIEPEPPDWVVIGASDAAGVIDIAVKDGLFALEARARVTVT
jgi:hypothetical protein